MVKVICQYKEIKKSRDKLRCENFPGSLFFDLTRCKITDDGEAVELALVGLDHSDDPEAKGGDTPDQGEDPANPRYPSQDPEDQSHGPEEDQGLKCMELRRCVEQSTRDPLFGNTRIRLYSVRKT